MLDVLTTCKNLFPHTQAGKLPPTLQESSLTTTWRQASQCSARIGEMFCRWKWASLTFIYQLASLNLTPRGPKLGNLPLVKFFHIKRRVLSLNCPFHITFGTQGLSRSVSGTISQIRYINLSIFAVQPNFKRAST